MSYFLHSYTNPYSCCWLTSRQRVEPLTLTQEPTWKLLVRMMLGRCFQVFGWPLIWIVKLFARKLVKKGLQVLRARKQGHPSFVHCSCIIMHAWSHCNYWCILPEMWLLYLAISAGFSFQIMYNFYSYLKLAPPISCNDLYYWNQLKTYRNTVKYKKHWLSQMLYFVHVCCSAMSRDSLTMYVFSGDVNSH